jgi:hypothetical protein
VLSAAVTTEELSDFTTMIGTELLIIDEATTPRRFEQEIRWDDAYHKLGFGARKSYSVGIQIRMAPCSRFPPGVVRTAFRVVGSLDSAVRARRGAGAWFGTLLRCPANW